jgi:pyridoxine kinase
MKRILTIQDISCVGKCSITVALPIISAMGVETAIIPTAVLSTHTMFKNFTCKDLDDQIVPITNHWLDEKIGFEAIYTGYLATADQIDTIKDVFDKFKTASNVIIVDPVMADNGKLYPAFDEAFAAKMATLCAKADIILPNLTEASFMTGMEYKEVYDEAYIKEMLLKLAALGAKISILTGVGFEPGKTGAYGYNSENGEFYYYENNRIDASYHGTGDIFASTFTGAMMNGLNWKEALPIAADYTAKCIETTVNEKESGCWYGVNFEEEIPYLLKRLEEIK